MQDERIWNDGLAPNQQTRVGGTSEYDRLKERERIWEDGLAPDEQAANPPANVRFDLIRTLQDMFAATGQAQFETSAQTWRAFSDEGLNGRSAEQRFREIGHELGFSAAQVEQLLAGVPISEIGAPAGRFTGPDRAGIAGAVTLLQGREPEAGLGALGEARNRFLGGVRDAVESYADEQGRVQHETSEFWVRQGEEAIGFTIDELTRQAEDAGDAGRRFLGELEEIKDLDRVEAFERLNQAILGGFTPQFELSPGGLHEH